MTAYIGVTLFVAAGAFLTGVNILHPLQGFTVVPTSYLDLGAALILMIAATAVCIRRLLHNASPGAELERFIDAVGGADDW